MADPLEHVDSDRAAEAFGLLADPVRVDILCAVRRVGPASFSTLQSAVGVDDSGQFNYHLGELTGQFIYKATDGYRLRPAGLRALNVAASGGFVGGDSASSVTLDGDCPECGAGLEGVYDEGRVDVRCPDCSAVPHYGNFPPQGAQVRDVDALFESYAAWVRTNFALAADGTCPYCGGATVGAVDFDPGWYLDVCAVSDCPSCSAHIEMPIGLRLYGTPAVGGFLSERGIDVRETPFWTFQWCLSAAGVDVRSRDPVRVTQAVRRDGDELRVTVDGSLAVVESAHTVHHG